MVNVVDNPGSKSAVAGLIAKAEPVNFTVTFAVAEAFAASRTVMSIMVSAVTAFGVTVNVEPLTFAVIGTTLLLLEKAV